MTVVCYMLGGPKEIEVLRSMARQANAASTRPLSTAVMEWDGHAWSEAK